MTDKTVVGSSKKVLTPDDMRGAAVCIGMNWAEQEVRQRCFDALQGGAFEIERLRTALEEAANELWRVPAASTRVLNLVRDALRPASETGAVYRKWPGEPPHCMSCDCGMTDEQKRTVPFEDYQTFHTALMAIVYESKSFTEAVKLASDALSHKPPAQKAAAPRDPLLDGLCDHGLRIEDCERGCKKAYDMLPSEADNPTHQHAAGCPKLWGYECECTPEPLSTPSNGN